MQPRYESVSIDEIISRAKVQLRLTHTSDYDSYLEMMVMEGFGSLGAYSQMVKKRCQITVTQGTAKLPSDFIKLIGIRANIVESTNDPIQGEFNQCNYFLYADTRFLSTCGCDVSIFNGVQNGGYQIVNGYIHFNAGDSIVISDCQLAYYGMGIDEKGRALIYSRYERALSSYACYMFTMAYSEKYNQYIIENYKQQWQLQRSKVRGEDMADNFRNEKRQIMDIWNSLVTSKTINYLGQ